MFLSSVPVPSAGVPWIQLCSGPIQAGSGISLLVLFLPSFALLFVLFLFQNKVEFDPLPASPFTGNYTAIKHKAATSLYPPETILCLVFNKNPWGSGFSWEGSSPTLTALLCWSLYPWIMTAGSVYQGVHRHPAQLMTQEMEGEEQEPPGQRLPIFFAAGPPCRCDHLSGSTGDPMPEVVPLGRKELFAIQTRFELQALLRLWWLVCLLVRAES